MFGITVAISFSTVRRSFPSLVGMVVAAFAWLLIGGAPGPAAAEAQAACTRSWTNPADGSWSDPTRWSPVGVPASTDTACIIVDGTYTVTVTGTPTVNTLTVGAPVNTDTQTLWVQGNAVSGNALLTATNGASIAPSGVVRLESAGAFNASDLTVVNGTLANAGTMTFGQGPGGNRTFTGNLDNQGTVYVNQNTSFNKSAGGYTNTGNVNIAPGKTLSLLGSPTFRHDGGALAVNGSYTQTGGTFVQGNGAISGTPWLISTTTATGSSTLSIQGTGAAQFLMTGSNSFFQGNIASGQTVTVQGNAAVGGSVLTSYGGFTNAGTLRLESANAGYYVYLQLPGNTPPMLTNTDSGKIVLSGFANLGGRIVNSGSIVVNGSTYLGGSSAGAYLTNTGSVTIASGASLYLEGPKSFYQMGGSFTINGTYRQSGGGTSTVVGGAFVFADGTLIGAPLLFNTTLSITADDPGSFVVTGVGTRFSGNIAPGQTIWLKGGAPDPAGSVNQSNALLTAATGFTNAGTIRLESGCCTPGYPWFSDLTLSSGTLTNMGRIIASKGSGSIPRIFANVDNQGTIEVTGGLELGKTGATYTNTGTISILPTIGTSLAVSGGATFTTVSTGVITGGGTLSLGSGVVFNAGGTVSANVNSAGATVSPGYSRGFLNITGNYTQDAASTLNIEIGGTDPGTGYDQVKVSGVATLAGTLNATVIGSYCPVGSHALMTYSSRVGDFGTKSIPPPDVGLSFTTNSGGTTYALIATGPKCNLAPEVHAGSDASISEGATFAGAGFFIDPGVDVWTGTVDYGDGLGVKGLTLNAADKTFALSNIYADNGTLTVTVTVTDNYGSAGSDTLVVIVANVAPAATWGSPGMVMEGSGIGLSLTGPVDVAADLPGLQYAFDCGDGAGYGPLGASASANCATTDDGARNVKARVQDKDGGFTEYTATVTITNVAPTATWGSPGVVMEGSGIGLSLTGPVDVAADLPGLQYAFDCGDGVGYGPLGASANASCATTDNGSRSVKGKVQDKDGDFAEYTATVTVTNVAPKAGNDSESLAEDVARDINVLANDTDVAADPLTITGVTQGAHGVVSLLSNTVRYRPSDDFYGVDSFTYTVSDGDGGTSTGLVLLTVTPVNDSPVAADDFYVTDQHTTLRVPAPGVPGVLANDTDVDSASLTAVLVSGPANGTVTLNAYGSFVYTPNSAFVGGDSFMYKANDGLADSNVATVAITVIRSSTPPVAATDTYIVLEGATQWVVAPGVLSNDSDPDGDPLTAVLVSGPTRGTLVLAANGSFAYSADSAFVGADSFTYKANDGLVDSNVVTVAITVIRSNASPVAATDTYIVLERTALTVDDPGVLSNDTDADGASLTAVLVSGPANGTVTLNAYGSFVYIPNSAFAGGDSFMYKANDGLADSNVATVAITVERDTTPPELTLLGGAGEVVAWGNLAQADVPARLTRVTTVAAGGGHALALKSDGTVASWGDNGHGQTNVPVGLTGVTAVAAGGSHSLALKHDRTVVAWGANGHGQTNAPVWLTGVTAVAAGDAHSLALKSDGTVIAWGDNSQGQTNTPIGLRRVSAIAAGGRHSLALKSDGTVAAWGDSGHGQANVPVGLTGVIAVAAGDAHSLALKSDGTVVAWGDNYYGQTNAPAGLTGVIAVAAGGRHSLALIAGITAEATAPSGAVVTFTSFAIDNVDGPVAVDCGPSYGPAHSSTFPLGASYVTCTATDARGNTAAGSFSVTVVDTTPPLLALPADMSVDETGLGGAEVSFTASATDSVDPLVVVTCTQASGWFAVGATEVTCTARDTSWNTSTDSFRVTVNPRTWDTDSDGVANAIDGVFANGVFTNQSLVHSSFTDQYVGGTTFGTVASLGGLVVAVTDAADPAKGVSIAASGGGAGTAKVLLCDHPQAVLLLTSGDSLVATCGSVIASVISGTVTLRLGADTVVEIPALSGATITEGAPGQFTVQGSQESQGEIAVTVGGVTTSLAPGQSTNRPPVCSNDVISMSEDNIVVRDLGLSCSDADGNPIAIEIVSLTLHGVSTLSSGFLTYAPDADYNGPDAVTFRGVDPSGAASNVATVGITVSAANDAPKVAVDADGMAVDEGQTAANGGSFADVDVGDSIVITASVGSLTQTIGANGAWSWSLATSDGPSDGQTVTITATDDGGAQASVTFALTVNSVAPVVTAGPDQTAVMLDLVSLPPASFTEAGSDTHTATINWGDGLVEAGAVIQGSESGIVAGSHLYALPGTYAVTVTITDDDQGVDSDVFTVTVLGPVDLKERTVQVLESLLPGVGKDQKKQIEKAIKEVDGSLSPELWIDAAHVDPKQGHEVFSKEREAVKILDELLKKPKGLAPAQLAVISSAIGDLVEADRLLALTLLNETTGLDALDPKRQDKVDKELAEAWVEIGKGDAERDASEFDDAVQHYRKAWEHATHGISEAALAPHDDTDGLDNASKGKGEGKG